jgi:hypothetical protein
MADLDLRGLRASIEQDDGDLIVVVHDGDVCVRLATGMGGTRDQAILGAEQLATVMEQFAELLRIRNGSRDPFTRATPADGS